MAPTTFQAFALLAMIFRRARGPAAPDPEPAAPQPPDPASRSVAGPAVRAERYRPHAPTRTLREGLNGQPGNRVRSNQVFVRF